MMRATKSKQPKSKSARKESQRQRLDKALEEGLEETFPAIRCLGDNARACGTTWQAPQANITYSTVIPIALPCS